MPTQLQLIEGAAPPRPDERCDAVLDAVAAKLLPAVLEWLGDEAADDKPEYIQQQIREALRYAWSWDGYEITKALRDWECNRDMVDIMDAAWGYARDAHDAQLAAWVSDYDIKPKFALGETVDTMAGRETVRGEIVGIDTKRATYTVCCASHGHVKDGVGCHGFIVRFEDTTRV